MQRRTRIIYTQAQKDEMWDRWQQGESLHAIARHFDRFHSSVSRILGETGGIRPRQRSRSARVLSLAERETISRGLASGVSLRQIAYQLQRAPSTVSREVGRNGGTASYRAAIADEAAWHRAQRPKPCKLACTPVLRQLVSRKLNLQWSPQQIAGWLKRMYPKDEIYQVSHETIYKTLFIQARGTLKKELQKQLRTQRAMRRGKSHSIKHEGLGQITNTVSISERPAQIEDRAVPGHWEGDMIEGSNQSYIATLVERHTRYVMLVKLKGKDTESVINALIKHAHKLPTELYKSLTWDRGKEMADHQRFTLATDIKVYFCDPQSPWQRGSNENTNGLLRQYFPKGTDLSVHSQTKLNAIARRLNERPRKTLNYKTPADKFNECVASIG
ncbi:MAG: IS30 family transposase [Gammaproteobacteria bacterium]|nr:IS30 family transposase [Gammaproteobacteria bacterium]